MHASPSWPKRFPEPELRGATWSPDGRRIAFSAWNGKQTRI
jgi:WD40-like Beta Propeller Repeat